MLPTLFLRRLTRPAFRQQMRLHSTDYRVKQQPCRLLPAVPASVMPAGTVLGLGIEALIQAAGHAEKLVEQDDVKELLNIQKCRQPLEGLCKAEIFLPDLVGIFLGAADKIPQE